MKIIILGAICVFIFWACAHDGKRYGGDEE